MKAPSADLLRALRLAAGLQIRRHGSPSTCCRVDNFPSHNIQTRSATTHSYSSQWKRSQNRSRKNSDSVVDKYVQDLVNRPDEAVASATRTAPSPPPAENLPKTTEEKTFEKARIVFGSRLAGPVEREHERDAESTLVAGISVPPKPEEPDNCCMSGCVNCVWDLYRDELEIWASQSAKAREALKEQRKRERGVTGENHDEDAPMPGHVANSMEEDGGGSEANWESGTELSGKPGDLFEDIPVGIREFMKQEKKLKEQRLAAAAAASGTS